MTKLDAYEAALRSIAYPDSVLDRTCCDSMGIAKNVLLKFQGDETFARIVLRAPHDSRIPGRDWWYHNFKEKGGLVADPLLANSCQQISDYVYFMEASAAREYPEHEWQRCRLNIDVQPFSDQVLRAMNATINEQLRRSARAKLTDLEIKALGIGEKQS